MRKSGYYWARLKYSDKFLLLYYSHISDSFHEFGLQSYYESNEFAEIDETPITRNNMNPYEEKATELVEKFYHSSVFIEYREAVIFANICVDEIIEFLPFSSNNYWIQVKSEINKL